MTESILINILVIIIGYIAKKIKLFPESTGTVLSRFVIYITLPATILKVFISSALKADLFILPLVSFLFGLIIFLLGLYFLRGLDLDDRLKWTLLIGICGYNVGLFSYPFIKGLYGDEGLLYMAMFDIGNSFIVFGLSYALSLMSENGWSLNKIPYLLKRVFSFFPLQIYIISLVLSSLKINFPEVFTTFVSQLSLPNSTLALFTLGYFLDFNLNKSEIKALLYGVLLRFIPGLALALLLRLMGSSLMIKIISIGVLLPAPLVVVIYSNERNLNSKFASFYVSLTILLGIIFLILFK
ncbi:AEC family transporter [Dictyoglomus thermophilum]|uniref:Transporter, auxin efflux carrier (AEC) family n=1 Tax=Dictyoglomus thermophilum (strain ATCC 35947 / DSM 3960 / H-6-12) TaxID=309799 RepID=B5YAI3_DICT6|nr:AEC family transporter [Dictyoglomus thermophilum]ACI18458.1 transporter, auxin efflux carrier (AEC) family [Dictyoglomus thermophilum H-6-12]